MISDRYLRQRILPEIGEEGQQRLAQARVLIAGCGALGTNLADLIARAGVGRITVVDPDSVELSNLQRQALMREADLGRPKAQVVAEAVAAINSGSEVNYEITRIEAHNVERLIEGCHLVLDGLDNLGARYLLNDTCVKHDIPWIFATVAATYGMTMPILPREGPCLRCLLPNPVPDEIVLTARNAGIINTIPRAIATIETTQAFKILLGSPECPVKLITYDTWWNTFSAQEIHKAEHCPCCSEGHYEFLEARGC